MRSVPVVLAVLASLVLADTAAAQTGRRDRERDQREQQAQEQGRDRARQPRIAPLRRRAAIGPCPYVKILYDAARYVELADNRAASANVGYTGEIQGVVSDCTYEEGDPITVQMNVAFDLGRGPQASADQRTYRYWIAVTERNNAVLAKQYFDLPVDFDGQRVASVLEERTIVIPRATETVSGSNFEVLVGFEVTPEMAEFNRTGSRFRVTAGQVPAPASGS